ncbi:sentrin-specific protease 2-like isoform X2 [Rosa chinensis]|uniref:sentrin-specific protease 2-like isoform X2 n=1 Tax=Rosa chinensis TaxID=74649 RepID=UPI000D092C72|nr:sentrin-specific protease 2-like isoform X2 [Rosa chinensis]
MGSEACIFQNDVSAVMWLEHFLREAGQNPLLLVLDDVWPGSESLLQKLDELNKMPNYKILVTSRFEFPGCGSTYYLSSSNSKEPMDLLYQKRLTTPTSAISIVPRMERREAMADDELRAELKAEVQAVKRDLTSKLDGINQQLVYLIQSKDEKGPERTKEIEVTQGYTRRMDVDAITEDFKVTQELQILATEQQSMRQFRAWIGHPDDGRRDLEIFEASKKWLEDLMTPGVWLSDTGWMSGRWTSFQNNPNSYEWDSDIMGYPLGKSPQFTRLWSEVDCLYIPVNVTNQHWVAVCVDLMRRKFTIYDSMLSANRDEFICDLLNPIATMFPSLLIQSGFYKMRPELSPLNTPFQVVRLAENIPQQSESGDCGVFVLKFVEYLSSGQQLSFRQEDIPAFRERMAFLMFAMSHDIGGNINTLVT